MTSNFFLKPDYLKFLMYQIGFRKNTYFKSGESCKYIENKSTKRIARIFYFIDLAFLAILANNPFISKLNFIIKVIIVLLSGVFLETIHWFYAKFDVFEE